SRSWRGRPSARHWRAGGYDGGSSAAFVARVRQPREHHLEWLAARDLGEPADPADRAGRSKEPAPLPDVVEGHTGQSGCPPWNRRGHKFRRLRCTAGKLKMVSGSKEKPNETDRIPIGWSCNAGRFVALTAPAANQEGASTFVTDIPPGSRDWRLISVAHEE